MISPTNYTSPADIDQADHSLPGRKYLTTIISGLKEVWPGLSPEELAAYLISLKGIAQGYTDSDLLEMISAVH